MATAVKAPPSAPADTPLGQLRDALRPGQLPAAAQRRLSACGSASGRRRATASLAGAGEVDGRPVFCYAQDPAFLGGSLGEVHADTIVRMMRMAGDAGAPVVGFVRSGGARLQEGHAALAGYGRIFRASVELSRKVPQISILSGVSAGGGAYSPALTDFVVMTEDSRMFLTGPKVVAEAMGEEISMEELGGPEVHGTQRRLPPDRRRRRADAVAADPPPARPAAAADRRAAARRTWSSTPTAPTPAPPSPPSRARSTTSATSPTRSLDGGSLLELCAALGAEHGHRVRPPRGPPGRPDRQPAAPARRRDRRRRLGEGGALRRGLRPLRPAAGRPRRHPRLHARQAPGGSRRDPPRRLAAARLRRRHGAEADRWSCARPSAAPRSR